MPSRDYCFWRKFKFIGSQVRARLKPKMSTKIKQKDSEIKSSSPAISLTNAWGFLSIISFNFLILSLIEEVEGRQDILNLHSTILQSPVGLVSFWFDKTELSQVFFISFPGIFLTQLKIIICFIYMSQILFNTLAEKSLGLPTKQNSTLIIR